MPPTLTANSSQLTGLPGQFNQKVDSCYVRSDPLLTAESQEKPRLHANLGHGHITAAQSAVGRSEAFDIRIPSLGPAQPADTADRRNWSVSGSIGDCSTAGGAVNETFYNAQRIPLLATPLLESP